MAVRTGQAKREYIENAPLPTHGQTYTVISHKFVIDETLKALNAKGFEIEEEQYRCNRDAEVAQGIYHLKYNGDPEMGMLFTWANSYDKTMRFKCAVGAHVLSSGNRIIAGIGSAWGRKHTGTADQETQKVIADRIDDAAAYYKELVDTKEKMKGIKVDLRTRAELLGRLFFEKKALSSEQILMVRNQYAGSMKFDYGCEPDSLWAMYNHLAYSLQKSHPRKWMDQQTLIHWFLCDHFDIKVDLDVHPTPTVQETEVLLSEVIPPHGEEEEAPLEIPFGVFAEEYPTLTEPPEVYVTSDYPPAVSTDISGEDPENNTTGKTILEEWLLGECRLLGIEIDGVNKFLLVKENVEISMEVYNASVELGWTIQLAPSGEEGA